MVTETPLYLIALQVIITFFVLRLFTTRAQVSEVDDLGIVNLVMALSLALIGQLYVMQFITFTDITSLIAIISCFYMGILCSTFIYKTPVLFRQTLPQILQQVALKDRSHYFIIGITFILVVVFSGFFGLKQIAANSADARIALAESNRILDIARNGSYYIYVPFVFCFWLIRREKYLWLTFAPFLVVQAMSGSKSFLLVLFFMFMTIRGATMGRAPFWREMRGVSLIGALGLVAAGAVVAFYGAGIEGAMNKVLNRLMLSGDVYLYAYVLGDYRALFGEYNIISYVMHPFLKLAGMQGYDDPLGSKLFEQAFGDNSFGPNAHLPMVFLVSTKGNVLLSAFYAFMAGAVVITIKYVAVRILCNPRLQTFVRLGLFFILFSCASLFTDLGLFQQRFIAVVLMLIALSGLYEALLRTLSPNPSKRAIIS